MGNLLAVWLMVTQRRPVTSWMGDHLRVGRYVSSYPGKLSLAILPWVGTVSNSKTREVNRHTTSRHSRDAVATYPWSRSVNYSVWLKERSAPPYGPCGSARTFLFTQELDLS